jgi:thiamine biosynthesis lipoprotein
MWRTVRFLLLGFFLAALCACQQQPDDPLLINGATMGTTWSVRLHSLPDSVASDFLKQQLQAQLNRVNELMSTYDPTSEVSRFNNQASTDWFAVSDETAQVVELSMQISKMTGGAFDISVGPLVDLWGFGAAERSEHLPTAEQVNKQLAKVGYQQLQLRQEAAALRKLHPQLQIDLSAVAKGYAVDLLAGLLKQQGITNFLVEVGGEMRVAGRRVDGTPWRIAIEKPDEGAREVASVFLLTETAIATSGNYRNFYIENGQRYVHTIDPVTGMPIRHKLASATVLDPNCARADAIATALMVMGEEKGRQFCEDHQIAAFFLIHEKDATIEYRSPAFAKFINKVKQ